MQEGWCSTCSNTTAAGGGGSYGPAAADPAPAPAAGGWEAAWQARPACLWRGVGPGPGANATEMSRCKNQAEDFVGLLDTGFMFAYAAGLFFFGWLGDRIGRQRVLVAGMLVSAISVVAFTALAVLGTDHLWAYGLVWTANGFLQASGWPNVVGLMGAWFADVKLPLALGVWASNSSVGNVVGGVWVGLVIDRLGWCWCLVFPAASMVCAALAVALFLPGDDLLRSHRSRHAGHGHGHGHGGGGGGGGGADTPLLAQADGHGQGGSPINSATAAGGEHGRHAARGAPAAAAATASHFYLALAEYSACYLLLKLVNYALFFWLNYYLEDGLGWGTEIASLLSSIYDIAAAVGGAACGWVTNYYMRGRSAVVVSSALVLAVVSLGLYRELGTTHVRNAALMGAIGFFLGGPSSLITTLCSVDIANGKSPEIIATVAGVVRRGDPRPFVEIWWSSDSKLIGRAWPHPLHARGLGGCGHAHSSIQG